MQEKFCVATSTLMEINYDFMQQVVQFVVYCSADFLVNLFLRKVIEEGLKTLEQGLLAAL